MGDILTREDNGVDVLSHEWLVLDNRQGGDGARQEGRGGCGTHSGEKQAVQLDSDLLIPLNQVQPWVAMVGEYMLLLTGRQLVVTWVRLIWD